MRMFSFSCSVCYLMCLLANESAFINFSMIFLPLRSVEGHSLVSFSISVCFLRPAVSSRLIWSVVDVICGFDGVGCVVSVLNLSLNCWKWLIGSSFNE